MSELSELEQLSALIGDIYDAALEPSLWPSVLQEICAFLPGAYANIYVQDFTNLAANSIFTWGMDRQYFQSYLDTHSKINPMLSTILTLNAGEVFTVFDLLPPAQLRRTRFYREWLEPQGVLDNVFVVLEKSATSCSLLAVPVAERVGAVTDDMRQRMRLLVPHIQRAVVIGKAIDLKSLALANLADTFDSVSTAIYLVNALGQIIHVNRSGLILRDQNDIFCAEGDRLQAGDWAVDRILQGQFEAVPVGDLGAGSLRATIRLTSRAEDRYVAHVLPLAPGSRGRPRHHASAVAAVFVHKAGLQSPTLVEAVAKHFRLTPGELRVLFAIIEVGGVPEVAPVLGVSESTVKTHLKRVFAKTGTSRQADLVRLVAELANPLTR